MRQEQWRDDDDALQALAGRAAPACPIVDAGMRQLRGRGLDAQPGPADHRVLPDQAPRPRLARRARPGSSRWLLDGDVANNYGNWQWVAGTGNDTKPYRRFNPVRQAERFDPDGDYVRRHVRELSAWREPVHEPWRLAGGRARATEPLTGPRTETWLPG